ncbi:MAG: hypothetical protein ACREX4_19775 [Gammaproteobacteria bacterium]
MVVPKAVRCRAWHTKERAERAFAQVGVQVAVPADFGRELWRPLGLVRVEESGIDRRGKTVIVEEVKDVLGPLWESSPED